MDGLSVVNRMKRWENNNFAVKQHMPIVVQPCWCLKIITVVPMVFFDSEDSSNTESQEAFPLRPYQRELAEPALDGKNCMIVAPTGNTNSLLCIGAVC